MAFMGMVIGFIVTVCQILKIMLLVIFVVFVIVGLLLLKKHKIIAIISLVIAGINLLILCVGYFAVNVLKYETPDGKTVTVLMSWTNEYDECRKTMDVERMKKLLDKHPNMIYYVHDNKSLIDYAMYAMNIEMMQLALDYGDIFDNPLRYNDDEFFESSLQSFFSWVDNVKDGETTDEMIATVRFALEHGAKVTYTKSFNYCNDFYEDALKWVNYDNYISPKDEELLAMIKEYLPENNT